MTILTKEGSRQEKLLDFRESTSEQVLLQPHLVLGEQLGLLSCNDQLANKIFEFFQFCKDLFLSTPDISQYGQIVIRNNGTRAFKLVHNNDIYHLKSTDNEVTLDKILSETYCIIVLKQQDVIILDADQLTSYNTLAIPQISEIADVGFYRTKDHLNLTLRLQVLIQLVTIRNFYKSQLAKQLETIRLKTEQISSNKLQDKLQQAPEYIIIDLNPDEQQRNINLEEQLSISKDNIIIDIHKSEGILQKEGSYFFLIAKSTRNGNINIIKLPQGGIYQIITKDGVYDLSKCMPGQINGTLILNSSHNQVLSRRMYYCLVLIPFTEIKEN